MSEGKLLVIEPEHELKFRFNLKKQIASSLYLTNKTDQYVAFEVWTTNPQKYEVLPNVGIISPGATRAIKAWSVTLQSGDKFLVQCFITTPHATVQDIKTTFREGSANSLEEHVLKVIYVLAEDPQPIDPKDSAVPARQQGQVSSEVKETWREVEATTFEVIQQLSTTEIDSFERECTIWNLEDKLKEQEELIDLLRKELQESIQKQHDEQRKADDLKRSVEAVESILTATQYSLFSYIELQEATNDFDNSSKIGEGGYGSVYKGFLHHTTVAIKKLDSQSMQGLPEFYQEVDILTKVRHPNLVNLMGACSIPEPCLVYEFLPNGSLEDRLSCKGNTPPLSWPARIRIAAEICSALIFLHSHKPRGVVHGDLKPSNILLDANLVAKLGDFGICRHLSQSSATTQLHRTEPKGTFPYIDPEFGYTGELTASSDIYSYGVILLQLLTGRQPLGLVPAVQDALTSENLQNILDVTAGDWPFLKAKALAHLGMGCCKMQRRTRPRLETDVWRVLKPMARGLSLESLFQFKQDDDDHVPSYFLCPILQEPMKDPQVAADGFTYEAEAIKGWFDAGHNTSPTTNLALPHRELLPNRALRSAIQEWLQQEHRRHF